MSAVIHLVAVTPTVKLLLQVNFGDGVTVVDSALQEIYRPNLRCSYNLPRHSPDWMM
jgi:hypothetical protein